MDNKYSEQNMANTNNSGHTADSLNPVDLLEQGNAEDTIAEVIGGRLFRAPTAEEMETLFPQYEEITLIGMGGMGAVYKVKQKELGRFIALKILPREISSNPAFSALFAREAKALAQLNHPHIVTIHDYGQAGDLYYITMEYVDGVNLKQLISHGRISPREALAIVPQICEALQYAHDKGIVHRDIKPENILLDREGYVKVADFGLAKLLSGEHEEHMENGEYSGKGTLLLKDGKTMGTPAYMSPEQLSRPGEVDSRADIYSLGVVLYQMLTGKLPDDPIVPPSNKVSIDIRLDKVVLKALEKSPDYRFQHASEMKTSLTAAQISKAMDDNDLVSPGKEKVPSSGKKLQSPTARLISFLVLFSFCVLVTVLLYNFVIKDIITQNRNSETGTNTSSTKTDIPLARTDVPKLVDTLDSITAQSSPDKLRYNILSAITDTFTEGVIVSNLSFNKSNRDPEDEDDYFYSYIWSVNFEISRNTSYLITEKISITYCTTEKKAENILLDYHIAYPYVRRSGKIVIYFMEDPTQDSRKQILELANSLGFTDKPESPSFQHEPRTH